MGWNKVEDGFPDISKKPPGSDFESEDVLVLDREGNMYVGYLFYLPVMEGRKNEIYGWLDRSTGCGCCSRDLSVTHWMPLPEKP